MQRALEEVGPHLFCMSDGETGSRWSWIMATAEKFRAHPDVELVHDGDYLSYQTAPLFRVEEGKKLDPDSIYLGYKVAYERSYPQFKVLRDRAGLPDLRFQIGIPSPLDECVSFENGIEDRDLIGAFAAATIREINEIVEAHGSTEGIVFQFETVVALVAVASAPPEAREGVIKGMSELVYGIVNGAPEGTHFGMHLCLGDFNHEAFISIEDVSPWVALANALAANWPAGRTLEYIHAPFAAAVDPPPDDEKFFAPVADLSLPDGVRFFAGFVHEDLSTEENAKNLARIESFYGREVGGCAAACGLARVGDEKGWGSMAKTRELIESS